MLGGHIKHENVLDYVTGLISVLPKRTVLSINGHLPNHLVGTNYKDKTHSHFSSKLFVNILIQRNKVPDHQKAWPNNYTSVGFTLKIPLALDAAVIFSCRLVKPDANPRTSRRTRKIIDATNEGDFAATMSFVEKVAACAYVNV